MCILRYQDSRSIQRLISAGEEGKCRYIPGGGQTDVEARARKFLVSPGAAHRSCQGLGKLNGSSLEQKSHLLEGFTPHLFDLPCRWAGVTWVLMESLPERPQIWTGWL